MSKRKKWGRALPPIRCWKDSIFVKKQHLYYRIYFKDIRFIKADNVYLEVNTKDKKFLVRSPLEKLPGEIAAE